MRKFPRADTWRSKRNLKRKVRKCIRYLNQTAREDVFGDRFSVTLLNSDVRPWDDNSGWDARFYVKLHDAEHPERDYAYWYDKHDIIYSGFFAGGRHLDSDFSEFIVRSDFWDKYRQKEKDNV
jgi:hypothetical protein